jgi:two-component system, NarL family, sensor histidine kinase UhpB
LQQNIRKIHLVSLKLRLIVIINGLLLLIMLAGAILSVNNARQNARAEVASAQKMVMYLFDTAIASESTPAEMSTEPRSFNLQHLSHMRHLKIELQDTSGRIIDSNQSSNESNSRHNAPEWVKALLERLTPRWEPTVRNLEDHGLMTGKLVITPDPSYEYAEIWKQITDLLTLASIFILSVNILISWAVGQALKPTEKILIALNELERGNLNARLPSFDLPELARIGEKFNLMVETLQQSISRNHRLSQQLITLQDEERKSLARDLHDEFGQCLTAIHTDASVILKLAETKYPELRESAIAITKLSRHLMDLVSGLLQRLRPGILGELGLTAALEDLVESWQSRHEEISCTMTLTNIQEGFDETADVTIYRILQECLTNISRHAGASMVEIQVELIQLGLQADLRIRVYDNGRGFEANKAEGFGLPGMRERVEGLGGELTLKTSPGKGTEIMAWIPTKRPS